jgi:diguanylate cyclase (GGDEF)-like protein
MGCNPGGNFFLNQIAVAHTQPQLSELLCLIAPEESKEKSGEVLYMHFFNNNWPVQTSSRNQWSFSLHQVSGKTHNEPGHLVLSVNKLQSRDGSDLEMQKLQQELELSKTRDMVTGLFNNKAIFYLLDREISLATPGTRAISVILADVDLFEEINQRYGRSEADHQLMLIGKEMSSQLRSSDSLARLGGDKFLAILRGMDLKSAYVISERIRLKLQEVEFPFQIKVTLSLGVAEWQGDGSQALVERAQEALYRAKNQGRNRSEL